MKEDVRGFVPMDDTVMVDGDALELTQIAKIEAGLVRGMKQVDDDLSELLPGPGEEAPLVCIRIEKQVALGGWGSGAAFGLFLRSLPATSRGKVVLMFDGWASDRRELHEIGIVVRFCRGLLLGPKEEEVDEGWAKETLELLLDEDELAFRDGELVDRLWLDAAGSVWLCSTAFADEVYERGKSPSGWMRNYGLSFQIREWLLGRGAPPGQEQAQARAQAQKKTRRAT